MMSSYSQKLEEILGKIAGLVQQTGKIIETLAVKQDSSPNLQNIKNACETVFNHLQGNPQKEHVVVEETPTVFAP